MLCARSRRGLLLGLRCGMGYRSVSLREVGEKEMPLTISVAVKPQAKREIVTQTNPGEYQVSVHAPAHEGKANRAVIELLSEYFSVPKSKVKIVCGRSARKKIVSIG